MKNFTPDTNTVPRARAFTLTELLVVLATVGIVILTLVPALAATKYKTKTSMCAFNMRLWGAAISMYESDNHDFIPYFGRDSSGDISWFDYLAPYVARVSSAGSWFTSSNSSVYVSGAFYTNEVRRCPAGNGNLNTGNWDTWIGANFGINGNTPLSGPFYYASSTPGGPVNPPLNISRIRKPYDAMAFMDTHSFWVYSPVEPSYAFTTDFDGDGQLDSGIFKYNYAQPKVHENGANVTLLDGHVERVAFKDLWKLKSPVSGVVAHSFWYLED